MVVQGKVRGLSNHYPDGVERQEIWVDAAEANGLPFVLNQRIGVTLVVEDSSYEAGLRATKANRYVWISPDLYRNGEKVRLADVLSQAGFMKNETIDLSIHGLQIDVARAIA